MDNEVFERIYHDYVKQVFYFLFKLSGSADLADELTQETFVRAYQNLDTFRGECRLYVWLCQIGKNLYYTYLKGTGKLIPLDSIMHLESSQSVEEHVLKRMDVKTVMESVSKLPEPYQTVFLYRVFLQLTYKEIGELLLKTEVWARVTYYRAKQKLYEEVTRNEM